MTPATARSEALCRFRPEPRKRVGIDDQSQGVRIRNVTFPGNQPNITTPKTENGIRQVPVDENLIALLDHPAHAKGYVIGSRKPITLTAYRWMYEKIEQRVDLHEATAHIFRHSYLTLLDAAGVDPKTLQSIAGHGGSRSP